MSELVMDRHEILFGRLEANLDAKVAPVADVPRARVAHDFAVAGTREERTLPESGRQRIEPQSGEEALSLARHLDGVPVPGLELRRHVERWLLRVGDDEVSDVVPFLSPHVAE